MVDAGAVVVGVVAVGIVATGVIVGVADAGVVDAGVTVFVVVVTGGPLPVDVVVCPMVTVDPFGVFVTVKVGI